MNNCTYVKAFARRAYYFLLLLPLLGLLTGCPYSSPYRLDGEPQIYADDELLGKWATMYTSAKGETWPVKLIIDRKNDNEYSLAFTGYLNELKPYRVLQNDSIKGSAFVSIVANRKFLNIEIYGQTYISQVLLENNRLSLLPLAEKFTAKYVKSGMELRTAVEIHFNNRAKPLYDEPFCLWNMARVN